ncbi:MAG: amidase family protein, partial [Polyangiales bacterium]
IGTDIGGSIRVPCHFCGIAGLKPTLDRWTNRGSNTALMGQEAIRGQCGPMARTSDDVAFFFEAVDPVKLTPLDGRVPPLPAGDSRAIDVRKLRVAVYEDDGLVPSSLAVSRGVRRAADALRARGCEVVSWKPPRLAEHVYLYFAAMSSDGGAMMRRGLEAGDVDPVITALRRGAELPNAIRVGLSRALLLAGQERLSRLLDAIGEKTVDRFWQITNQLRAYRFELTEAMDRAGIDVVLCPAHATPALPHLGSKDFVLAGSTSMLWNIVQFPAGVVPVTRVLRDEAHRDHPRDRLETMAAKVDQGSAGLPVGVQVVARPWREDLVLAAMRAIEDEARKDADFPKTPVEAR